MRRIVCEDCKRVYDCDKDDFCPRCGAFNQPVKTWTTDDQGNIRRVDGVNEANHAGSFVHSEVHREKRVRRTAGLDQAAVKKKGPPSQQNGTQAGTKSLLLVIFIIAALVVIGNIVLPFLVYLLSNLFF